jgi:hypothetical protein
MYNAQTYQDLFVDRLLDIDNGYFVDIGAGTGGLPLYSPGFYSNTYFFESRGWNGLAIDYDKNYVDSASGLRKAKCILADLNFVNINSLLQSNHCPEEIDYLSLDVDDVQLKVFNDFDFEKYKFKILTLEHNLFQSFSECNQEHTEEHKTKIVKEHKEYRSKLQDFGYKILLGNVVLDGYGPVEDWYVNQEIYEKYKHLEAENINCKEVCKIGVIK